jgi:hypothetical protein
MAESDGESAASAVDEVAEFELMDLAPDDRKQHRPNLINGPSSTKLPTPTYPNAAPLASIHNHLNNNDYDDDGDFCGLCGTIHGAGACFMTDNSENLAEFRQMLITHDSDEPLEDRVRSNHPPSFQL